MSYPFTRAMAAATAGYGVYALVRPDHLPKAMEAGPSEHDALARIARGYGVRDLAISALTLFGPSATAIRVGAGLRIANDLTDATLLSVRTDSGKVRAKVLAATLGWASLNTLALVRDVRNDPAR
jgi:hypothetical protein